MKVRQALSNNRKGTMKILGNILEKHLVVIHSLSLRTL